MEFLYVIIMFTSYSTAVVFGLKQSEVGETQVRLVLNPDVLDRTRSTFLFFLHCGVKFSISSWKEVEDGYRTIVIIQRNNNIIKGFALPFNLPFLVEILQCILIWRERRDREITLTGGDGPVSWRAVSTMNCAASSGFAPFAAWLVSAVDTRPARTLVNNVSGA